MKHIAVLLTVYNRKANTLHCMEQLYAQIMPEDCAFDVWLTDDGCTDGTPEAIRTIFPQVHIIQGDGNLYWNRGMYKAWEAASKAKDYDFYLWLNDDTYLFDVAVHNILEESHTKQDRAIISGATKSSKTDECTYGLHDKKDILLIPNGTLQNGTNLNGNFVLIPKYVFQILGNLDYYYHHAGGDTDYGLRANENGIEVLLSGDYVGYCERHSSLSIWCNPDYSFKQRWKALNKPTGMPLKVLFYHERKHYGLFVALFHICTTITHCMFPKLWNSFSL
ncbi:MAG: glycosyltransferase family 2 protein [Bacteroidaceae bacterium]|nr:glycosyltransferase family 2 protein [Bacteroidaceae bacterium]